jgi:ABC-type glycerol-3-phosphate transport system substrate-binding protein
MVQRHLLLIALLGFAAVYAAGCGRPVMPGQQFRGKQAVTSTVKQATSPLPENPVIEAGPQDAKVRIVAFFPMDDDHKPLIDLLKGFAKEYPGKVYTKYVDYRTPTGYQAFQNAKMTVPGVMINTQNEYTFRVKPNPYTVDFSQDMGRYWTAEDLKRAVAEEVKRVYGPGAAASR